MKSNLQRIIKNKQAKRQTLTALPVAQKLEMLDALRDRARSIRKAAKTGQIGALCDHPTECKTRSETE